MEKNQTKKRMSWLQKLAMSFFVFTFVGCASVRTGVDENNFTSVELSGVQHMGPNFNISDFYVDHTSGSNVGRGGGGGGIVCCVALPKKWRPNFTVEVRWAVGDWSKQNKEETALGNFQSITFERYKAIVPVEKYDEAEHVWVHFFAGGKVRVVSSAPGSLSKIHPIQRDDQHAVDSATIGSHIDSLFTSEELAEMRRKSKERSRKYGE
jgi:hypothetical protein